MTARIDHAGEVVLALTGRGLERFEEKFKRTSECWPWLASLDAHGYGRFSVRIASGKSRMFLAHRVSYETFVGPIPVELDLDHLCRVRSCINPDHLEPVTRSVNLSRSPLMARGQDKTHCPKGHPYDELNTRVSKSGARNCRECARARDREKTRAGVYNRHISCIECGKALRERNMPKHMNAYHPANALGLGATS